MTISRKIESAILLIGDVVAFVIALWLALYIRYGVAPSDELIALHATPFAIMFAVWVVVFFIFDLYGKQTAAFRRRIFSHVVRAQIVNSVLAVLGFYFIPAFIITPKTILFINLVISLVLVILWRAYVSRLIYTGWPEKAILLGSGPEIDSLRDELLNNPTFNFELVACGLADARRFGVRVIIVDLRNEQSERHRELFYELMLSGVQIVDARSLYESIFDRVPLSLLEEGWFLENISGRSKFAYDFLKRLMDCTIAGVLWLLSLPLMPLVALAIVAESGRPVFITQTRVGRNNKPIKIIKYRSMTASDSGSAVLASTARITRVGAFLRRTRIDEFPQLWNVLRGDVSLIGPRPELPALADLYRREIPFYDVRHLIKPGLSGWAQIYHEDHPHHGSAVMQTKDKLSYDLYYVKNRSFVLDFKIALKTIKTLLSAAGA